AGFEQHPDKTFFGRVEKGFDWMGFWFTEKGCDGVAPRALQHFKDRLRRLYERVRQWPEDLRLRRMVGYVRNWLRWSSPPPRQTPAQPVLQPGPRGRVTALSKYDIGDFSVDVIHLG
ncbi:hypothetical protein HT88_005111, partial [Salmonella enterica subsp. enterica]|nr:hypothetical protein [Salmonella enterica subsp. enterica]